MTFTHQISPKLSLIAQPVGTSYGIDSGKGLYNEVKFKLIKVDHDEKTDVGYFRLSPLPGCCGVVVSHDTYLNDKARGSNISDGFRALKTALCKHLGYSAIIATSRMDIKPSLGNMVKSGYKQVETFKNSRTGNPVAIGVKLI